MHIAKGDLCREAVLSKWQVQHPGTKTCQFQMTTASDQNCLCRVVLLGLVLVAALVTFESHSDAMAVG